MARHHGLDAARAGAILGVVVVHSLAAHAVTPIGWAVSDAGATLIADLAMWIGRAFLMPVFFLLAGHLAHQTIRSRGALAFVASRGRRLLVPLLVLIVPASMAMNAMWDWGAELQSRAGVSLAVPALEGSGAPLTLAHLWYIYYLIVFSAVAGCLWRLRASLPAMPRLPSTAAPVLVAVAVAAALLPSSQLQLDTPLGFAIDPWFALAYGAFFIWGWHLDLAVLARRAGVSALVGGAAFAALVADLVASADGAAPRAHAIVASGVFSVATTAAFTGLLLRVTTARPAVRFLADASYWTYIAHLPVVVVLQIGFSQLPLPAALEVLIIGTAAVSVSLVSYELLVRRTFAARFVG